MVFDKILSSFKNFVEKGEAKYVRGQDYIPTPTLPVRKPLDIPTNKNPQFTIPPIPTPFPLPWKSWTPEQTQQYIQYALTILLLLVGTYFLYVNRTPPKVKVMPH